MKNKNNKTNRGKINFCLFIFFGKVGIFRFYQLKMKRNVNACGAGANQREMCKREGIVGSFFASFLLYLLIMISLFAEVGTQDTD